MLTCNRCPAFLYEANSINLGLCCGCRAKPPTQRIEDPKMDATKPEAKTEAIVTPEPNDCYHKAKPGEPVFTLLGRDPQAAALVCLWAAMRTVSGENEDKCDDARRVAEAMALYARSKGGKVVSLPETLAVGLAHVGACLSLFMGMAEADTTESEALKLIMMGDDSDDGQGYSLGETRIQKDALYPIEDAAAMMMLTVDELMSVIAKGGTVKPHSDTKGLLLMGSDILALRKPDPRK